MGKRADVTLHERGLFESRAKAREAIEAGLVRVDGRLVKKPSEPVDADAVIEARAPYPWVSRGGVKLAHALDAFGVDVAQRICLDIGASTGGFTDVLLARGATRVVALDVGHNQLHPRLRADPRVVSLEGQDARALTPAQLGDAPGVVVIDASFISLSHLLSPVLALAAPAATLVALIKPQFEVGRTHKGIVRDVAAQASVCARVRAETEALGWRVAGVVPSPIAGGDGNREFLLCAARP